MTIPFTKYQLSLPFQKKLIGKFHLNFKRIIEPVFLGSVSNLVINFILNPKSGRFHLDEFFVACILSIPITELNRYIDNQLGKRINWIVSPKKRFSTHLILITSSLLIFLNIGGNTYLWITGQGFFSWQENAIINIVTVCMAIMLTFISWAIHFYSCWIGAETVATESARLIKDLRQQFMQTGGTIEIQKGTSKIKVEIKNIRIAKIELGIVRIYSDVGMVGFFPGTLSQLNTLLPTHLFFQVTRDAIIHREIIKSIASASFGKIEVMVSEKKNDPSFYTVSRPKAAAFRKWYNSIST